MAKNTLTFSPVQRTVIDGYNREKTETVYVATYNKYSGVLHIKQKKNAKTKVFANAGEGYLIIAELNDTEFMAYLNMEGFNSVQIECGSDVDFGVVNEF